MPLTSGGRGRAPGERFNPQGEHQILGLAKLALEFGIVSYTIVVRLGFLLGEDTDSLPYLRYCLPEADLLVEVPQEGIGQVL